MPVIHKVEPVHHCDLPYSPVPQTIYGEGTIWQCETCKHRFKLICSQFDGWVWMPM